MLPTPIGLIACADQPHLIFAARANCKAVGAAGGGAFYGGQRGIRPWPGPGAQIAISSQPPSNVPAVFVVRWPEHLCQRALLRGNGDQLQIHASGQARKHDPEGVQENC